MDVECPSQGSDKGDADPPKPAANVGAKISGGFRHHLPQIPVMNVGHKIAQSKASAKQENRTAAQTSLQRETTKLHIEGTGKVVEISGTGKQEEIFTPPETESSSNSSPGDVKPAKNGSAKDRLTGTPIKLRIRRANRDGELDLSSCVDEAPQNIDNSFNESRSADSLASAENPEEATNTSPKTPSNEKRGRKKKVPGGSQATPTAPVLKSPKVDDGTPKWLVGDLVWSKVSGHPWWPCMVSYDPYEGVYTKLRSGKYRMYHVQFFGDERERGWVSETATMPFGGKQQLEDYFKSMLLKATPKQRAQYKLDFSGRKRRAWDIAWQAAEEAIPLSKAERKQKYTYSYDVGTADKVSSKTTETGENKKNCEEDTGTGRTKTKAKLKKALITARTSRLHGQGTSGSATPSSEDGLNGEATSKRGRKRKQPHYAESESEDEDQPSPRRRRKKRETSPSNLESSGRKSNRTVKHDGLFEVFCDKHQESVLSDNPDFDEKTLSEYLQQQWDMMDSKQKSRYRSKFGNKSAKTDDGDEEIQTGE